jgi:hypothetical protein
MIYPLTSTQLIASWSENSNTFHSSSHSTLMCLRSKPAGCGILASGITLQIQELNPTANLHPTTICCPQIARESEDFEWCDLRIQSLFASAPVPGFLGVLFCVQALCFSGKP